MPPAVDARKIEIVARLLAESTTVSGSPPTVRAVSTTVSGSPTRVRVSSTLVRSAFLLVMEQRRDVAGGHALVVQAPQATGEQSPGLRRRRVPPFRQPLSRPVRPRMRPGPPPAVAPEDWRERMIRLTGRDPTACPVCGHGYLRWVEKLAAVRFGSPERSPPP